MREDSVGMISRGLCKCLLCAASAIPIIIEGITSDLKVKMNYEQYEHKIVLLHGVDLRGWPKGLVFQSPSKMMNVSDLMKLRDALLAKTCCWVRLDREELREFGEKVQRLEAEGVLARGVWSGIPRPRVGRERHLSGLKFFCQPTIRMQSFRPKRTSFDRHVH